MKMSVPVRSVGPVPRLSSTSRRVEVSLTSIMPRLLRKIVSITCSVVVSYTNKTSAQRVSIFEMKSHVEMFLDFAFSWSDRHPLMKVIYRVRRVLVSVNSLRCSMIINLIVTIPHVVRTRA